MNPEVLQGYSNFLISKQQPEEALNYLKQSISIWKDKEEDLPPFIFRVNNVS